MNFIKWCLRRESDGTERVKGARASERARGPRKEALGGGWGAPSDAHVGGRKEAHRAKVEGEMERGPFKRPSQSSETGGLSTTPGPACGALP